MIDDEGHLLPDPAEVGAIPVDFEGIGEPPLEAPLLNLLRNKMIKGFDNYLKEKHPGVFADFEKMVAHIARTHHLHQDEVEGLLISWWNSRSTGGLQLTFHLKI